MDIARRSMDLGPRVCRPLARDSRSMVQVVGTWHRDVTTDSKAPRLRIRKASRARAPDSPMPGEGKDARTAWPDEES